MIVLVPAEIDQLAYTTFVLFIIYTVVRTTNADISAEEHTSFDLTYSNLHYKANLVAPNTYKHHGDISVQK